MKKWGPRWLIGLLNRVNKHLAEQFRDASRCPSRGFTALRGKCLKINMVPPFEKIREANKEKTRTRLQQRERDIGGNGVGALNNLSSKRLTQTIILSCLHIKQPVHVQTKHISTPPWSGRWFDVADTKWVCFSSALNFHMLNTQPADGTKRWWSENKQYTPPPSPQRQRLSRDGSESYNQWQGHKKRDGTAKNSWRK